MQLVILFTVFLSPSFFLLSPSTYILTSLIIYTIHLVCIKAHPHSVVWVVVVFEYLRLLCWTEYRELRKDLSAERSRYIWGPVQDLVAKKHGSTRFCVDNMPLNSITKKDVYPLPRIDDTLDSLTGKAEVFQYIRPRKWVLAGRHGCNISRENSLHYTQWLVRIQSDAFWIV